MTRHFDYHPSVSKGHQFRWLAGGYDLEIGHFLEVTSIMVTWRRVDFFSQCLFIVLILHFILHACDCNIMHSNSNSNSNVFCIQALVPLKIMFFGALFQEKKKDYIRVMSERYTSTCSYLDSYLKR